MKKIIVLLLIFVAGYINAQEYIYTSSSVCPIDSTVYQFVEKMPEYKGGKTLLYKYLANQIGIPEGAEIYQYFPKIYIQYIVEKGGEISNVQIIKSSGYDKLDNEALRIVKSMPAWFPGSSQGQPVRVKYTLPIAFKFLK